MDAGLGLIYCLDGWGSRMGGSELGKKVKELYGKPGLISSRCKTLWGLCYGGFKGYCAGGI